MSFKSIFLFLACAFGLNLNAQQINLDSLIGTKKTVFIEYKGLITTWLSKNNW